MELSKAMKLVQWKAANEHWGQGKSASPATPQGIAILRVTNVHVRSVDG